MQHNHFLCDCRPAIHEFRQPVAKNVSYGSVQGLHGCVGQGECQTVIVGKGRMGKSAVYQFKTKTARMKQDI